MKTIEEYCKILGVPGTATKDEIKKAYYKLAHVHHPDKNGGDDKKFKEINEAYQALSNKTALPNYPNFTRTTVNQNGFTWTTQHWGFDNTSFTGTTNTGPVFGGDIEVMIEKIFKNYGIKINPDAFKKKKDGDKHK